MRIEEVDEIMDNLKDSKELTKQALIHAEERLNKESNSVIKARRCVATESGIESCGDPIECEVVNTDSIPDVNVVRYKNGNDEPETLEDLTAEYVALEEAEIAVNKIKKETNHTYYIISRPFKIDAILESETYYTSEEFTCMLTSIAIQYLPKLKTVNEDNKPNFDIQILNAFVVPELINKFGFTQKEFNNTGNHHAVVLPSDINTSDPSWDGYSWKHLNYWEELKIYIRFLEENVRIKQKKEIEQNEINGTVKLKEATEENPFADEKIIDTLTEILEKPHKFYDENGNWIQQDVQAEEPCECECTCECDDCNHMDSLTDREDIVTDDEVTVANNCQCSACVSLSGE